MPIEAFVGLGSNVDPERHLGIAMEAIRGRYALVEPSPVYRNPAVGFTGDDFLNMVVRLSCDAGPTELERSLSALEEAAGRQRAKPGDSQRARALGPRTLDLDLLLYGSMVDAELRLPRDDVLRYPFVLRSLVDLVPELVHPISGRTLATEWAEVSDRSPPMQVASLLMSD